MCNTVHHGSRQRREICQCDTWPRLFGARNQQPRAISEHDNRALRKPHCERQVRSLWQRAYLVHQQWPQLAARRTDRIPCTCMGCRSACGTHHPFQLLFERWRRRLPRQPLGRNVLSVGRGRELPVHRIPGHNGQGNGYQLDEPRIL